MDTEQASLFFALLSCLAIAVGVAALGAAGLGRLERVRAVADMILPLAFVVALVCTLGSLYYSNVADFRPCRLCWWQRIFMYPLTPMLLVASLRRDTRVGWYGIPLAVGGLGYAAYHSYIRWWPPDDGGGCEVDAACTSVWVNTFGFVSIPFMAGAGFLAILGLLTLQLRLTLQDEARGSQPRS